MPLIELLLMACLLAIIFALWLRVDALQQQVRRHQAQLLEFMRRDLGAPTITSSMVMPPTRSVPRTEEPMRARPSLRLVKP